jgi:Zn-dependent protease with chaperone function
MPTAAEHVEMIDTQVYHMLFGQEPTGAGQTGASRPMRSTVRVPVTESPEPPIDWAANPPGDNYEAPICIARSIFHWLLSGRLPADGAHAVEPESVPSRVRAAIASDAEILAIWAYARAVALVDATARRRVDRLRTALGIGERFDTDCAAALQPLLTTSPTDPVWLLTETPQPVTDAVAGVVAASVRKPGKALLGLSSIVYQHPTDRAVQGQLMDIPLLGTAAGAFTDFFKRSGELALLGQAIEVTQHSIPGTYRAYRQACSTLGIDRAPRLFVSNQGFSPHRAGEIAAESFGADEPYILLGQEAASILDPAEQVFLLGRELGHVQANHVKYRTMARWLERTANWAAASTAGLVDLVSNVTFRPMLAAWYRRTAYTADRAGLLACQNREIALRVLMKQAGYPMHRYSEMKTRALVEQAIRFREETGFRLRDLVFSSAKRFDLSEPWVVDRAFELLDWIDNGEFQEIVDASEAQRESMAKRMAADPNMQLLLDAALREVIIWGSGRFGVRRAVFGEAVRRIVYDPVTKKDAIVEQISRIELVVTKAGPNQVEYAAKVLFRDEGEVKLATITIPFESAWDETPSEIREDYVRHGGSSVVRLLYPRVG